MTDSQLPHEPFVLAPGEGRRTWFLGGLNTRKTDDAQTQGHWELTEQRGRRGFAAPVHVHHRQTEAFYVLEGEITYHLGEREVSATAGAFALVPPQTRHAFVVESNEARILVIVSPPGLIDFFEGLGRPADTPGLPSAEGPMTDPRELEEVAKRFDMTILGPPPRPRNSR